MFTPKRTLTAALRALPLIPAGFLLALLGCASSVPAKYRTSEPIALQKSFFGPFRYTHQNGPPEQVYGLVTYSSSFKELLSQRPAALAEAQGAAPFLYGSSALSIGYAAYGAVTIANVLSESDVSNSLDSFVGVTLAYGVFAGVLGYASRSHLLRAVDQFNSSPTVPEPNLNESRWSPAAILPTTMQLDRGGRLEIGWTLRY
ncbi:MAG: hypothetical protein ACREMA_01725 [Longimicrobiales bacterium]